MYPQNDYNGELELPKFLDLLANEMQQNNVLLSLIIYYFEKYIVLGKRQFTLPCHCHNVYLRDQKYSKERDVTQNLIKVVNEANWTESKVNQPFSFNMADQLFCFCFAKKRFKLHEGKKSHSKLFHLIFSYLLNIIILSELKMFYIFRLKFFLFLSVTI